MASISNDQIPDNMPHDRFFRSYFQRPDILLFEHKSWSDPWVTLQLLRDMTRIWSRHEREKRRPPLPPVIPIVIYDGESRRARPDFGALLDDDLLASFLVETLNLTAPGVCRTYGQN